MTDGQVKRIVNAINGLSNAVFYSAFIVWAGLVFDGCMGHR